jgi:hypothetical protein
LFKLTFTTLNNLNILAMKKILLLLMLSVASLGSSQVVVEIPGPITFAGFNFNNLFPNSNLNGTLTSVQIQATLSNSVSFTYANDLTFYVTPDANVATGGLLQIGGFSNLLANERRNWGCEPTCDSAAAGTIVSGTVSLNTPINFTGSSFNAWLGNGYGADGTAGTFTNIILTLTGVTEVPIPTARLQVIHNSPDAAASEVDVYVNGDLFIDNFAFRTASEFVTATAGVPLNIQIAPATSESATEAIFSQEITLDVNQTYIVIANGIVSPTGYSSGPNFGLSVYAGGREAAINPAETDILVNHGSPDAPAVDVVETSIPAGIVVNNIAYPSFQGYLELPTLDFVLDVRPTGTSTTVASYLAPLQTLELEGTALTVIASGFLDPSQNSNGPAFGLFVASPSGGALLPLPLAPANEPTARLQVIHNSPDAAAAVVDVYVNGNLFIDNFSFRTASEFVTATAGVPLNIQIAPATSESAAEAIFSQEITLDANQTYIVIANGIVSSTGYSSGPNFGLSVYAGGREAAINPAETDILVNHGSPDAPAVDVVETAVPAGIVVNNISFPQFQGYLELPTLDFTLDIRPTGTSTTVASFLAPLQTLELEGTALTVIASGFLDPSQNSNGPAFGLWVATAAGGALIPLPTNDLSINGNSKAVFTTYPNPVKDVLNLEFPQPVDQFSANVVDLSGRVILSTNSFVNGIDVSGLSSGMYMLEVNADGASNAIKFIKN